MKIVLMVLLCGALTLAVGCAAMNSLVFHPIHKVWEQHEYNVEQKRAEQTNAVPRN